MSQVMKLPSGLEGDMRELRIEKVPDHIVERLRQRAQRNSRSLQSELLNIICRAAEGDTARETAAQPIQLGTRSIDDIATTIRTRGCRPDRQAPSAADIVRADRDTR